MKRDAFIASVAERSGLTRSDARLVLAAILDLITDALRSGDAVAFTGFGKFTTRKRTALEGFNVRKSDNVRSREITVPKFKPSRRLKHAIRTTGVVAANGGGEHAASAPGEAEATRLRRTPHLDLDIHEPLEPGGEIAVTVFADTQPARPGETSREIDLETPPGVKRVRLTTWLAVTEHFELLDEEPLKQLTVSVEKDRSTDAVFSVRVRDKQPAEGRAEITAYFAYKGRGAGSVARTVKIAGLPQRTPRRKRQGPPPGGLDAVPNARRADLQVHVTEAAGAPPGGSSYTCTVFSKLAPTGLSGPWLLDTKTDQLVGEIMNEFTDEGAPEAQRAGRLTSAGKQFFSLSPQVFRDAFWALVDAGKTIATISIESQEPFVPWELMVPHRPGEAKREPLGVASAVGRWLHPGHLSADQELHLEDGWVVAPKYTSRKPLRHAEEEAAMVCQIVKGTLVDPATWTQLNERFQKDDDAALFHFVGHGEPGGRALALATEGNRRKGGRLGVLDLDADAWPAAGKAFHQGKPLVFLNACEVGRTAPSLLGTDGLATAFAVLGATAIVAPLWSVDDEAAFDVASTFYGALMSRKRASPAALLQSIRRKAYDGTGSDSHAAYCFFGDPHVVATTPEAAPAPSG